MANKKFLPIKIFEKRKDYDERSTEGGGDSKEPSWVLHGETLSAHSAHLRKEISEIKGRLVSITEMLNMMGCETLSKTNKHVATMKKWLEKAKVLNGWDIKEKKLESIVGIEDEEIDVLPRSL